jgi:hypothetical protein
MRKLELFLVEGGQVEYKLYVWDTESEDWVLLSEVGNRASWAFMAPENYSELLEAEGFKKIKCGDVDKFERETEGLPVDLDSFTVEYR